jgi:uncharacterized membrane protein
MISAIYLIAGLAVAAAGFVLIGRHRRRYLGSLTLFIGLNLILLSYALWQGIGEEASAPGATAEATRAATPAGT